MSMVSSCPASLRLLPFQSLGEWWSSEQVCWQAAAAVETSLEFAARTQEHPALLVTCAIEKDQSPLYSKALGYQLQPRVAEAIRHACFSLCISWYLSLHLS